ncbi:MAG TPA: glutamate racemase [Elusimicrobiales bacterium]|nr:glutamate racemase [Elusimicrobiales bacterium]
MKNSINESPIGIFDSGLGGLTVYREIRKILPNEDIVYFGDTMRVPYGNKSPDNIRTFAKEISIFLKGLGVKTIVVACNTVSSIALDVVRKFGVETVFGVIEPGVKFALKRTRTGKIIVIGTRATVNSHAYKTKIMEENSKIKVVEKACPLFVPIVEENFIRHKSAGLIVEEYLGEFKNTDYDSIILGCTHYPLLKNVIKKALPKINIIDSSKACAYFVKDFLYKKNMLSDKRKEGSTEFYVSDMPQNFKELAYRLAGVKICKINIKRF